MRSAHRTASTKGVLRPEQTAARAGLRRDHPVSGALEPYVERYWSVAWDLTGRPAYRSEVLSHPCVNLSVESGDGPRHGHRLPAGLVHGVVTRRFTVDLHGRGRVTAAKFRPGGFAALTGHQVGRDAVLPLAAVTGPDAAARVVADVLAVDDDLDRAAVLDAYLARDVPEPDPAYLELLEVLAAMLHDRSLVRVDDVATGAGTTVRSLQRLFHRFVGVGPKRVLQRYRLQDAAAAIDAGEVDDLAALAADLGWFDQAHFSRDFRATVGVTPSEYLGQAAQATRGKANGPT
jgi:AraC-like DNA-binding protein